MTIIFSSFDKKRNQIRSNINNQTINTPLSETDSNLWSTFHSWKDYDNFYYSDYFKVRLGDFYDVGSYKNNSSPRSLAQLYRMLYNYDRPNLDLIYSTLSNIQNYHQLDRLSFANVLVSFVQSIPYAFVFESSCNDKYNSDYEVRKAMDNGTQCDGFNIWGLNSPIEFMKNLYGDCDTRTLFLYTIMKKFGYKVVILNSDSHSMLGVKLSPSGGGTYMTYLGERYYMWETTAKNWEIGVLPPNEINSRWEIIE